MYASYQSKVWLHADKQCIQSFAGSPELSGGWLSMGIGLAVAWSTLLASQNVSLRHGSAANLIKSAHLPAAAMPKIVASRHRLLSWTKLFG